MLSIGNLHPAGNDYNSVHWSILYHMDHHQMLIFYFSFMHRVIRLILYKLSKFFWKIYLRESQKGNDLNEIIFQWTLQQ